MDKVANIDTEDLDDYETDVANDLSRTAHNQLFRLFCAYDFTNDHEFQYGLDAVLKDVPEEDQDTVEEEAKVWFFSKKFTPIDIEAYRLWKKEQSPQAVPTSPPLQVVSSPEIQEPKATSPSEAPIDLQPASEVLQGVDKLEQDSNEPTPYPSKFAEIAELIRSGKEIPGIKQIPDRLTEEQPSESNQGARKKPWEQ
ncbi:hypothetical protein SAICODRAFT_7382 [Saitoella complicata NRRL Y-17804]|nr:uncharacterized protein SAICODRAFT_7382 [Saitoella complicata NRRL Y-17804]ODQ53225.1 hypothetical protein SAICODRAFT_7382 [Saitoella complicata NRRL Y-17804]